MPGLGRIRRTWHSSNESWSVGRSPRPRWSTSGSRRRSRSRCSRPTPSRRPRTRPRRSSSSSRSAASSLALGLNTLIPIGIAVAVLLDDRRHVVPPDDLRLPERWRQLRRQPREPRREPVARRGRVAARRLHPHRRGVDLGRRRRDRVDPGVPGSRRSTACCSGSSLIAFISLANLRGIKESGRIFAVPTYIYIAILAALVSYGLFRSFVLDDIHRINVDAVQGRRATTSSAARSASSSC